MYWLGIHILTLFSYSLSTPSMGKGIPKMALTKEWEEAISLKRLEQDIAGDKSNQNLDLTWRDKRYLRFYEIVDQLVIKLQEHIWAETGQAKRRLKGRSLEKLHYSTECLLRDCLAVVLQRKRKADASIQKGKYNYGANRTD